MRFVKLYDSDSETTKRGAEEENETESIKDKTENSLKSTDVTETESKDSKTPSTDIDETEKNNEVDAETKTGTTQSYEESETTTMDFILDFEMFNANEGDSGSTESVAETIGIKEIVTINSREGQDSATKPGVESENEGTTKSEITEDKKTTTVGNEGENAKTEIKEEKTYENIEPNTENSYVSTVKEETKSVTENTDKKSGNEFDEKETTSSEKEKRDYVKDTFKETEITENPITRENAIIEDGRGTTEKQKETTEEQKETTNVEKEITKPFDDTTENNSVKTENLVRKNNQNYDKICNCNFQSYTM